eukprot:scaffold80197_cov53-Phaeocystis_antarctica.AAC.2
MWAASRSDLKHRIQDCRRRTATTPSRVAGCSRERVSGSKAAARGRGVCHGYAIYEKYSNSTRWQQPADGEIRFRVQYDGSGRALLLTFIHQCGAWSSASSSAWSAAYRSLVVLRKRSFETLGVLAPAPGAPSPSGVTLVGPTARSLGVTTVVAGSAAAAAVAVAMMAVWRCARRPRSSLWLRHRPRDPHRHCPAPDRGSWRLGSTGDRGRCSTPGSREWALLGR